MIPVNQPLISKNAEKYVLDSIKSGWISSGGRYINLFEESFAKFIGIKYAVTTTSGTSALHLSLAALGISKGMEVIIPDLTIISCALAVIYTGATPVVVDVDPKTGNIDPAKIEAKITKKTKAIMVVHLYGQPAQMKQIVNLAKKHGLYLIEDAAEAHGAEYRGKLVGGIGDVGCFSFYGNKIITCGEGGMVVTNNKKIYQRLKSLKDLAHSPQKRFLHHQIGFNYRMTNLQAALGLAQLEEVEKYIFQKRWMASQYNKLLKSISFLELPEEQPGTKSVYWMYAVKISQNTDWQARTKFKSQNIMEHLKQNGVDTRSFFYPIHKQPALRKLGLFKNISCPVSLDLSKRGFYLPSGLAITKDQIKTVVQVLQNINV